MLRHSRRLSLIATLVAIAVATASPACNGTSTAAPGARHAWFDDAVIYGLAPWFVGGKDFSSLGSRLDEIARTGATVLWLSPVTAAPPNDFGYAVTDPFELRRAFGTESQFRTLLSKIHAHGLRVMLDIVTNHLARQSHYFLDAQRGRGSPYHGWFEWAAADSPVHYFDWNNLENLNYDNAQVRDFTMAALAHWVGDYPVDGLRLDAIWALRERAPVWLPLVIRNLERINPEIVVLAEASALDRYYSDHGFDAAYDWSNIGQWAWHDIFGAPGTTADVRRLREALGTELGKPPGALKVLHFLNDNDTGKRFITRHGLQQTRVAAVLLFTLPGIPLIYAGDEVGAEFEPYRMKAPIDWSDRYSLGPLYRQLVQLRHRNEVLRDGRITVVATDADDKVLAFIRWCDVKPQDISAAHANSAANEPRLVVINFSPSPVRVRVQLRPGPALLAAGRWSAVDPIDGTRAVIELSPEGRLELQGYDAWVLRPQYQ